MAQGRAWIGGACTRVLGVAVLCALVAIPGCQRERSTAEAVREEAYVVRAEQLLDEGRSGEALSLLAMAIERNPMLTVAHLRMGEIYQERGDLPSASIAYEKATVAEPGNFDAQYGYGLVQHLMNRLPDAIRAYLRALTIRPDDFDTNFNLATAYLELREARQALPFAERAVSANPESGQARINLGAVYNALGRHEDAVREYEAAAELMEMSPRLLLNLARSLGKLKRYEEMANTLRTALEIEPSAAVHERLGYALFKLRQYEDAKAEFANSLRVDTRYYPAMNGMGVALLNEWINEGKSDDAKKAQAIDLLKRSLLIRGNQTRIQELVSRFG